MISSESKPQDAPDNSPTTDLRLTERSVAAVLVDWLLRLVPAVIVGRAAWMKLSNDPNVVLVFTSLEMEPAGRLLIGLIEAICVLLLLSSRLSAWGGILCLGVMSGAIIAHITVLGFDGSAGRLFVMAVASGVCSMLIIYRLRHQVPFVGSMFAR